MTDIFTILLGVVSICALAGAVARMMLSPPKVWDKADWIPEEIEEVQDYEEIRRVNPHIWMD